MRFYLKNSDGNLDKNNRKNGMEVSSANGDAGGGDDTTSFF